MPEHELDPLSSSESEASDEGEWLDADGGEDEEESLAVISLMDDGVFPDALSMLQHCKDKFSLDFLGIRDRLGLDFHGCVKLINFIRQHVREGAPLPAEITAATLEDDRYLKPVLDDDALILCLDDLPEQADQSVSAGKQAASQGGVASGAEDLLQRNAELQAELERLTKLYANYRTAVQQTLDQRWGADEDESSSSKKPSEENKKDNSDYYFESYAFNDIHETMLKDTVRTDAYRDFIYGNKHLFADKVVLDIGCGTGILSMFCAKAGAKRVIAVDMSAIIDKARENIFNNGLDDKITCLRGRIEDVVLPVDKVDIIVSEWMGYCLLYEAMLPSVLYARDRYLAPDGLLVPSYATLWIAPVADPEYIAEHIAFWRDVYGFDMKAMQEGIHDEARVQTMGEGALCGKPFPFRPIDLHTVKVDELVFTAPWKSTISKDIDGLDGFLVWFDIFFGESRSDVITTDDMTAKQWVEAGNERVSFTTGPAGQETHWRQGLLLNKQKSTSKSHRAGEEISGEIVFAKAENNPRALTLKVDWQTGDSTKQTQTWALK